MFAGPSRAAGIFDRLLEADSSTTARARRRVSLWDRWWLMSLFIGALLGEWWLRRR
jgi:hypothetical protein